MIISGLALALSFAVVTKAEGVLTVTNNEVSASAAYPSQWDVEVLDFTLMPAEDDVFNALTVRNTGLAPSTYLENVILYLDDGDGIFEGWKRDIEIGNGTYYDQNGIWYWKNLNVAVSKSGKRFFVAVETKNNGKILGDRRTLQFKIPAQNDENADGVFDFATDAGIFMNSKNNGPENAVLNSAVQTIYKKTVDSLPPVNVITYPSDQEKIAENSLTILGVSRDQGGSTPSLTQINIAKEGESGSWTEVTATGSNYASWKYDWNDIADGTYTIKIKSSDWVGNNSEENGITVTVDTTPQEPVSPPTPPAEPTPPENGGEEKPAKPANVSDGDLVRASGDYRVYIIKGDYKRWIQSAEIFEFYGHLGFSVVKDVTEEELDSYNESWLIRAEGDRRVYEVNDDGTKHWLNMTAEKFTSSGRSWDMVYVVNKRERDFYATGADVN